MTARMIDARSAPGVVPCITTLPAPEPVRVHHDPTDPWATRDLWSAASLYAGLQVRDPRAVVHVGTGS